MSVQVRSNSSIGMYGARCSCMSRQFVEELLPRKHLNLFYSHRQALAKVAYSFEAALRSELLVTIQVLVLSESVECACSEASLVVAWVTFRRSQKHTAGIRHGGTALEPSSQLSRPRGFL